MNKPVANKGMLCPLYRRDVSKVCHTCEWYVQVKGQHPQSDEMIDNWGCAMAWMPVLMINTAKEVHQSASAMESFRNNVVTIGKAIVAQGKEARVSHTQQGLLK